MISPRAQQLNAIEGMAYDIAASSEVPNPSKNTGKRKTSSAA